MKRLVLFLLMFLALVYLARGPSWAIPPSNVRFTTVTFHSLDVRWEGTVLSSSVMVLSTVSDFSTILASGTGPLGQLTTNYSNLSQSTTYYFRVKFATTPNTDFSFPISTSTLAISTGVFVTDDGAYTAETSQIHFTWDFNLNLIDNVVETLYGIGTTTSSLNVRNWTSVGFVRDFTAEGLSLENETTYYVFVLVEFSTGISNGILVDIAKPLPPNGPPQITARTENLIIIWPTGTGVGSSGISGYELEQRDGRFPNWISSGSSPGIGATITLPNVPRTYFFRVRTVSGAGLLSDPSAISSVNFALGSAGALNELTAYPNPFDSRKVDTTINYILNQNMDVEIRIYDLSGQIVKKMNFPGGVTGGSAGNNDVLWDGRSETGEKVSKGVYICVVQAASHRETFKIGVLH